MPGCLYNSTSAYILPQLFISELVVLTPQTYSQMRHHSRRTSTMPMRLTSGDMNYISHLQSPWRLSFRTDQTCPHRHGQNLAVLVSVPECSGSRGEADVVSHAGVIIGVEDRVHVDCAAKGFCGLSGGGVGFVGAFCDDHFGGGILLMLAILVVRCWVFL